MVITCLMHGDNNFADGCFGKCSVLAHQLRVLILIMSLSGTERIGFWLMSTISNHQTLHVGIRLCRLNLLLFIRDG
jgi:hypothetical protein